jgi:menaquinone-dependent protoporphyrinogen oxidase
LKILIAYASAHGSTAEIAQFIADALQHSQPHAALTLAEVSTLSQLNPESYDVFVLGTPIHGGAVLPEMLGFIRHNRSLLASRPLFFWMSCIRILEPNGLEHVLTHYVPTDFQQNIHPVDITAFAGKLTLMNVDSDDRWVLSAQYDGDKHPEGFNGDYRDWDTIGNWVTDLSLWLTQRSQAAV